ncbi:MAG: hypothetical protein JWR80_2609 [Bradyrhizobium sp.]|nr:hypothetical protein [Bradyrhizobium sp.]
MQFPRLDSFAHVAPIEAAAGHALPSPPASMDPSDHLSPVREEALQLLKPNRDWTGAIWIAGIALLAGFGLGWAGSSSWNSSPTVASSDAVIQKDASPRRAEAKSSTRADTARKQATLGANSNNSPRPSFMTRSDGEGPRTTAALSANPGIPAAPPAAREPVVAAPETRPATVEGWTVREVRGGTVVLEGPDGIRTGSAGDTVPGVGRIDSIVRWGNHWIVATAIGLIASP